MRVFLAVKHSLNQSQYYGSLWSENFYPALEELGCQIIPSQVDLCFSSKFMQISEHFTHEELQLRARTTQKIVDEVRIENHRKRIDLFISYFYNSHFDPAGFEDIHKLGIPTVNFFCNSIYQFDLVADIAPHVMYSWYPEKEAKSSYLSVGANPIWVQMGANPQLYHPIPSAHRQPRACFIGQRYADRDRLLAKLLQDHTPVDIYGKGWGGDTNLQKSSEIKTNSPVEEKTYLGRKLLRPGSLESYRNLISENLRGQGLIKGLNRTIQMLLYRQQSKGLDSILSSSACGYAPSISKTFAEYEVVLNFSNVWSDGRPGSRLIPHVRLRDFEAPMSRACYLTGYTDEISEFYDLGKEIDTYQDSEELGDKTKFYLNHPELAEKMREAGYQRALRDHTWKSRFKELFRKIGLRVQSK